MKTIILPVTWEVCGFVKVEAHDIESAIELFNENPDSIPLPKESEYVDGSFALTDSDPEFVKLYNSAERAELTTSSETSGNAFEFDRLRAHIDHNIAIAVYGDNVNISVECTDCNEVLYSVDNPLVGIS